MNMITNHPDAALLARYVAGELDDLMSLMVAAHVDLCPGCQKQVALLEARAAEQCLMRALPQDTAMDDALLRMMDGILATAAAPVSAARPLEMPALQMGRQRFELPRALHRFASRAQPWRQFGARLWLSKLAVGDRHLELMYMDHLGSVPRHSHDGREFTLILQGGFDDGDGEYGMGDFVVCDGGAHEHAPTATHEPCLCLALTEAPLHFGAGLPQGLSSLVQWFR